MLVKVLDKNIIRSWLKKNKLLKYKKIDASFIWFLKHIKKKSSSCIIVNYQIIPIKVWIKIKYLPSLRQKMGWVKLERGWQNNDYLYIVWLYLGNPRGEILDYVSGMAISGSNLCTSKLRGDYMEFVPIYLPNDR